MDEARALHAHTLQVQHPRGAGRRHHTVPDEIGAKGSARTARGGVFADAQFGGKHPRVRGGTIGSALGGKQIKAVRLRTKPIEQPAHRANVGDRPIDRRTGCDWNEDERRARGDFLHRQPGCPDVRFFQPDRRGQRSQLAHRWSKRGYRLRHPGKREAPVVPLEIDWHRPHAFPKDDSCLTAADDPVVSEREGRAYRRVAGHRAARIPV